MLLSSPSASSGAASGTAPLRPHPGAIIESMHHHGKGVYSGTFSGESPRSPLLDPPIDQTLGPPLSGCSGIPECPYILYLNPPLPAWTATDVFAPSGAVPGGASAVCLSAGRRRPLTG